MYRRVQIEAGVKAALFAHVAAEPVHETGGILLGNAIDDHTIRITEVSPPGPGAVKRPSYFSRDTRFLQRWLERRYSRSRGRSDYVGEWHVHHALGVPPSSVDRRSLWRIAKRTNYAVDNPVLLIAEDVPGMQRLRGYGFVARPRRRMGRIEVVVAG
jgi:integrative and conjugative element protein (TIGR02256 family)